MAPRDYRPKVVPGVSFFLAVEAEKWKGKRVGLIINQASVTIGLKPTLWAFLEKGLNVSAIFTPEHGLFGEAQAGEKVASSIDEATGIPVHSLYGETKKPTPEMLENVDILIYDLPEIGARYSTYIATMILAMQSAAENGIPFIVLDRPNPIGGKREGNVLDIKFRSPVGILPIPNRHGLTPGELAILARGVYSLDLELLVIPMVDWKRRMFYDDTGLIWINPSPNLPNLDNVWHYPGACFLEGTNISEGRGTMKPFKILGAPWIRGYELAMELNSNSEGVFFREVRFVPTFSKYKGEMCQGVEVHILDPKMEVITLYIFILQTIKALYPDKLEWIKSEEKYVIDSLAGTDKVRKTIDKFGSFSQILEAWLEKLESFEEAIKPLLLYE